MLTIDQVVAAVLRVGLEDFSMKGVAEELGVTVATLYKYVEHREHLFRLAVDASLAATRIPEDVGQPWRDYVRGFALAVTSRMATDRQIMDQLIHAGIGKDTEAELDKAFITAMLARGISAAEAERLLELVGVACFGTAVRIHCDAARDSEAGVSRIEPREQLAAELLERALAPILTDFGTGRD